MIMSLLAILALPVGFLAAGVAFNSWRSNETGVAWKAAAVFLVCAGLFIAAPRKVPDLSEDCWIDWDGRANPTVCD